MPHLAEELLRPLLDAELDGELPQLLQVFEKHGMRKADQVGSDAHRVPVEVDEAEAALGVGVPQEAGDLAVGAGDHEVVQGRTPGRVRPHPGEHGEGHGQRAHHPALHVAEALALVPLQPLGELPQSDHRGVVRELGRNRLQPPSGGIAAHHLSVVQGDLVVPGRHPPHECLPAPQ